MKKIFFAAAAMLMLFSCKEKEMPVTPEEKSDAIEITPESKTFGEEGGSVDVIVTSTGEWTLSAAENYDWVEVSATEGVDGDIVKFTVAENFDADKKGDFEFVCGEAKAAFTVFSYAGDLPHIYLDSDADLTFDDKEHSLEILVSSDETNYRDLEIEVSEGAEEWLVYRVALPGDTELSAKINFDVTALEGLADRDAVVTITAPGINDVLTVNVLQLAKHVLYTDKANYTAAIEGETIIVPLYTNVEYEITMEGAEGWLTVDEATAEGIPFTATALEGEKRSATVTFTQTDAAEGEDVLYATITITQVGVLINWAADMTGNRLFPKWENGGPGVCKSFTLETLVKFDDFDKATGGIYTIMGIEGKFLLRTGDVGNPLTNLQIATAAGNYNVPYSFEANRWYHIAVVWEERIAYVYFDGEHVGTSQQFPETTYVGWPLWQDVPVDPDLSPAWSYEPDGTRVFWMGYSYDANRDLHGLMTEIRIWNKALTADEINAPNHFYTVDPNSEGLFSYWKFVEGEGSTIADATGKGNPLHGEVDITKQSNGDNNGPEGIEWVEVALPDR